MGSGFLYCATRAAELISEDHGFLWTDFLPIEAVGRESLIFAVPWGLALEIYLKSSRSHLFLAKKNAVTAVKTGES